MADFVVGGEIDTIFGITKRLMATEKRLDLPAKTLVKIAGEPDSLALIKMTATIEPVLNDLIEHEFSLSGGGLGGMPPSERFSGVVEFARGLPLGGGKSGKLQFALALGAIDQSDMDFVESLSRIRNRYAHHVRNSERSLKEMWREEAQKGGAKFNERLFYRVPIVDDPEPMQIKMLVVWAFSEFLNRAEDRHNISSTGLLNLLAQRSFEAEMQEVAALNAELET